MLKMMHIMLWILKFYIVNNYNVQPSSLRYREHMCSIMYRHGKRQNELDCEWPTINLRSNNKVNFKKANKRKYELYLKSPKVRGVQIREMLPANVQKATTKVKFKRLVKAICRT